MRDLQPVCLEDFSFPHDRKRILYCSCYFWGFIDGATCLLLPLGSFIVYLFVVACYAKCNIFHVFITITLVICCTSTLLTMRVSLPFLLFLNVNSYKTSYAFSCWRCAVEKYIILIVHIRKPSIVDPSYL